MLKVPVVDSINPKEFVNRVKEAVKGKNTATDIKEAVKLLLKSYGIKTPVKK